MNKKVSFANQAAIKTANSLVKALGLTNAIALVDRELSNAVDRHKVVTLSKVAVYLVRS